VRADLGPVAAHGLILVAGLGVVNGLGLVGGSLRGVVAGFGLAYMSGAAAVMLVLAALVALGVPFGLPIFVATCVAVGAAGLGLGAARRRSGAPPASEQGTSPSRWGRVDRAILAALVALLAVYLLTGLVRAGAGVLTQWDSWSIWTRKALLLFSYDEVPAVFFTADAYALHHPDYPIGLPILEAVQFRAMGRVGAHLPHVQIWLLVLAFVWALVGLATRLGRPVIWAPIVLVVAVAPAVHEQALSAYADVPMGVFLGIGALLLGMWLSERSPAHLALAALMLAGAAAVKSEGLLWACAILAAAALVLVAQREWKPVRSLALAGAGFALAALPWRIWVGTQDAESDVPIRQGLEPGFLVDRLDRLQPAVKGILSQVADLDWVFLVPVAFVLVIACLVGRRDRTLAAFYLVSGGLIAALLLWFFLIRPLYGGTFAVSSSAHRYVTGLMFVSLAAAVHLGARLAQPTTRENPDVPDASTPGH
jgi:hypothetical protein